jgi:hypothetical protein
MNSGIPDIPGPARLPTHLLLLNLGFRNLRKGRGEAGREEGKLDDKMTIRHANEGGEGGREGGRREGEGKDVPGVPRTDSPRSVAHRHSHGQ